MFPQIYHRGEIAYLETRASPKLPWNGDLQAILMIFEGSQSTYRHENPACMVLGSVPLEVGFRWQYNSDEPS